MKTKVIYAGNGNGRMDSGNHLKNRKSINILKVVCIACIAFIALLALFIGCKEVNKYNDEFITMTTAKEGEVRIYMAGSGTIAIDWGDGSEIETHTLHDYQWYVYNYSDTTSRTITITGNITSLMCAENQLTKLDVSANTTLLELQCLMNQLTNLDVSSNTELKYLSCGGNKLSILDLSANTEITILGCRDNSFDVNTLNTLFETLHDNEGAKLIDVGNNPGADNCNQSIATNKGWTFIN